MEQRENARRLVLVYTALLLGVCAFTWLGKTLSFVFAPLLAAWFICYLIVPIVHMLEAKRVPRPLGYAWVFAVTIGIAALIGRATSESVAIFRSNSSQYQENVDHLLERISVLYRSLGLIPSDQRLELSQVLSSIPADGAFSLISGGTAYATSLLGFVSATLFLLLFMLWESESFSKRVKSAYGEARGVRILSLFALFNRDMRRYVLLKVAVSAVTGAAAFLVMYAYNLDFAAMLALLVFLLNFIPYVGSILSTLLPFLVAALQFAGWQEPLILSGLIIAIHQILGNVVEPKLQGKSLDISPLVILVTLVYFGWMWGIVGMVVSVPLTSAIRLVLEQFEITRSFARMIRDTGSTDRD